MTFLRSVDVGSELYTQPAPEDQEFWLTMSPSLDDYTKVLVSSFAEGLEQVQVFERCGKHSDLSPVRAVSSCFAP